MKNIAEILKDCPKGMELDCTMFENTFFDCVTDTPIYPIRLYVQSEKGYNYITLTKYGQYTNADFAKCIIFPKGKTTWEGFQRPFKDGDVVYIRSLYEYIAIYKKTNCKDLYKHTAICISFNNRFLQDNNILCCEEDVKKIRFATEEEKYKLFDVIKANGYKWNAETKTLEKLKKEKFDITTLKPFDKVLVRDLKDEYWNIGFFSFQGDKHLYTARGYYAQCIPYEGNKHLLGTTNDCDEYYKTWE